MIYDWIRKGGIPFNSTGWLVGEEPGKTSARDEEACASYVGWNWNQ